MFEKGPPFWLEERGKKKSVDFFENDDSTTRSFTRCFEEENEADEGGNGEISRGIGGVATKVANGNITARGSKQKKKFQISPCP